MMDFVSYYFKKFSDDCLKIQYDSINLIVSKLAELRENNGRLFILGSHGSQKCKSCCK